MLPPIYTTPPPLEAPVLAAELHTVQSQQQSENPNKTTNQESKPNQQEITVDDTVQIRADSITDDLIEGKLICEGDVELIYGLTKIKATRVVLDRTEQKGTADGVVQIVDPEGIIQCSDLVFFWRDGGSTTDDSADRLIANGTNALIRIDRVIIRAATLEIIERMPGRTPEWILGDVKFSFTDMEPRGTRFRARKLRLYPGKYGLAEKPGLDLFGLRLGPIPEYTFNLDKRVSGFKLPSLADRRGAGFGITWDSSFLLNDKTGVGAAINVFPRHAPSGELFISSSPLDPEVNPFSLKPRSDLEERYRQSWFENVIVDDPESYIEFMNQQKLNYGLGTTWNFETEARPTDSTDVSKLIELSFDHGTRFNGFGLQSTARIQRIRPDGNTAWSDRLSINSQLMSPIQNLGGTWKGFGMIDGLGLISTDNQFGYLRGTLGVFGRPVNGITVGGTYSAISPFGTPEFGFDGVPVTHSMNLRADFRKGPFTFSYLAKYDLQSSFWYDKEWELAIAAGTFEPFIVSREFPSDFRMGIRFRINSFVDRLQQRNPKREGS